MPLFLLSVNMTSLDAYVETISSPPVWQSCTLLQAEWLAEWGKFPSAVLAERYIQPSIPFYEVEHGAPQPQPAEELLSAPGRIAISVLNCLSKTLEFSRSTIDDVTEDTGMRTVRTTAVQTVGKAVMSWLRSALEYPAANTAAQKDVDCLRSIRKAAVILSDVWRIRERLATLGEEAFSLGEELEAEYRKVWEVCMKQRIQTAAELLCLPIVRRYIHVYVDGSHEAAAACSCWPGVSPTSAKQNNVRSAYPKPEVEAEPMEVLPPMAPSRASVEAVGTSHAASWVSLAVSGLWSVSVTPPTPLAAKFIENAVVPFATACYDIAPSTFTSCIVVFFESFMGLLMSELFQAAVRPIFSFSGTQSSVTATKYAKGNFRAKTLRMSFLQHDLHYLRACLYVGCPVLVAKTVQPPASPGLDISAAKRAHSRAPSDTGSSHEESQVTLATPKAPSCSLQAIAAAACLRCIELSESYGNVAAEASSLAGLRGSCMLQPAAGLAVAHSTAFLLAFNLLELNGVVSSRRVSSPPPRKTFAKNTVVPFTSSMNSLSTDQPAKVLQSLLSFSPTLSAMLLSAFEKADLINVLPPALTGDSLAASVPHTPASVAMHVSADVSAHKVTEAAEASSPFSTRWEFHFRIPDVR